MSDKRRIAMVAYTFFAPDARVRRHVKALLEAGYAVDVFCLRNPDGDGVPPTPGLEFFYPRFRRYDKTSQLNVVTEYLLFALICGTRLLRHQLGGRRYALVHVNNMPNFLVFAALPLRLFGVPVLLDIHDTMPEIYQDRFAVGPGHPVIRMLRLEERLSMAAAGFVMTTEHTKWERLLRNGLRRGKSAVTLNLPDADLFPDLPVPAAPPAGDGFRLIYHGTFARRLGLDLAVRAVARVRDRIPGLRFDIIGDGEQRSELEALVAELDVADVVRLSPGFVPTCDLPAMVRGADLALIPSRNTIGTSLMLPTKMLEYVCMGIPCLTVPTPTITHYFDERAAYFVPTEDVAAIAEGIVRLHADPERRLALARSAKRFFADHDFAAERRRYLDCVARMSGGES